MRILLGVLVVALLPLASAHPTTSTSIAPNLFCHSAEQWHGYVGSGVGPKIRPTESRIEVSLHDGNAFDDCAPVLAGNVFAHCGVYPWSDPVLWPAPGSGWCDGVAGDFDFEEEFGVGGGFFPAGPWAADPTCDYGYTPHHGATPVIDDAFYPLLSTQPGVVEPALYWGADDAYLDLNAGTRPSLAPGDQPLFGGDGLDCFTDGAITPTVDADDWLFFCHGEYPTTCAFPTGWPTNSHPYAGGDGGYWAFTVTGPGYATLVGTIAT